MGGFLLRKVGAALIVLFLSSILVFGGIRALPGDPALAQAAKDRPIIYLYHAVNRDAQSKKVGGIKLYGDGLVRVAFAGFTK